MGLKEIIAGTAVIGALLIPPVTGAYLVERHHQNNPTHLHHQTKLKRYGEGACLGLMAECGLALMTIFGLLMHENLKNFPGKMNSGNGDNSYDDTYYLSDGTKGNYGPR